jgi:hypothetical protein
VPRELGSEGFERLREYYADDPEVTVMFDRRSSARRQGRAAVAERDLRVLRDRRRRRITGDIAPMAGTMPAGAAAA